MRALRKGNGSDGYYFAVGYAFPMDLNSACPRPVE